MNCKDEIALIANMVTILAFVLAVMAFFNWRKEQKHAKKLDYIMSLEDRFEVLLHSIKMDFFYFSSMEKKLINAKKRSEDYKKQLRDSIIDDLEIYKNRQTLEKDLYEYSLALVRVKRFLEDIDVECKALGYYYLKELDKEAIELAPKWIDENTISNESKKFLERVDKIHREGLNHLRKKYK